MTKLLLHFSYSDPGQIMVVCSLLKRHFFQTKVNSMTWQFSLCHKDILVIMCTGTASFHNCLLSTCAWIILCYIQVILHMHLWKLILSFYFRLASFPNSFRNKDVYLCICFVATYSCGRWHGHFYMQELLPIPNHSKWTYTIQRIQQFSSLQAY